MQTEGVLDGAPVCHPVRMTPERVLDRPQPVGAAADRPRLRRRWLIAGVAVIVALAALGIGLWWRWLYSAHALDGGAGGSELNAPRPVGAIFYSPPMVLPAGTGPVTLDVRSVTPRITENSAGATIKVLICHRNDSITHLGSDDLSFCAATKPFEPGTLTIGHDQPGENSIILAIRTSRLGKLTIDGVHVTYRQGWRHGSQDTGGPIVVRAVRAHAG
jgi:hypothetical protein